MANHPNRSTSIKRIREHLLENEDVLRVRVSRNGDVCVYTTADRGDGGATPWWQLKGNLNQHDFLSYIGLE